MTARQRRWIWLLVVLNLLIFLAIVPAFLLNRNAIFSTLEDWTGERDPAYQARALAFMALSVFQPPRETADYAPMPYTDLPPFGVNTFFEQEVEEAKIRAGMQLIRDAGFHYIRQEFPWEDIEQPKKGEFYDYKFNHSTWNKYDLIVDLAHEYGLEVIARLDHPPAWTHKANANNFGPPDNYDDYGDFVNAVVSRYKGKIKYYQLWNEPNLAAEWGGLAANAADYTRLLKTGYIRAKQADPDAVIISAGLAQTLETGPENLSDLTFLQQMYDAGAKDYFDIFAAMNYGLFTGPGDHRADPTRNNFSRPELLREIMVKHGDANKPMWAMEIGWNALPTTFEDAPYGRVTEAQQSQYAVQAYERAQSEWPWMGVMNYWFFKRAYDNEREQPFYYFRLFDPDFTVQPAYNALKNYTPTARWLGKGYHQETDWALDFSGDWTPGAYGPQIIQGYAGGKPGAQVSFDFQGNEVALAVAPGLYQGAVEARIDSGDWQSYDLRATDPATGNQLTLARNLPPGKHHADVRVTGGELQLDGVVVRTSSAWLVTLLGWVALLAGALALGVWLLVRARGARAAA